MRKIRRIVKVHESKGYKVSCLFDNGESRLIDFASLFKGWEIDEGHIAYPLLDKLKEFKKFKIIDGTFVWENIAFETTDSKGNPRTQHFGLDPIVLYEQSTADPTRVLLIGPKIKEARKAAGLSQEELANNCGTTKHYISKLENGKITIQLMTLKKIVEGMGKTLEIKIV